MIEVVTELNKLGDEWECHSHFWVEDVQQYIDVLDDGLHQKVKSLVGRRVRLRIENCTLVSIASDGPYQSFIDAFEKNNEAFTDREIAQRAGEELFRAEGHVIRRFGNALARTFEGLDPFRLGYRHGIADVLDYFELATNRLGSKENRATGEVRDATLKIHGVD